MVHTDPGKSQNQA